MISNTVNPIIISSNAVNVTATEVQFVFRNYPPARLPYFGGLYVYIAQAIPTGTTGTLPVVFTSEGGTPTAVVGLDNEPITAASITGTGVYHFFYDQRSGRLQLLSPYIV